MAKQDIFLGTAPGDSTGDTLRTAGQRINSNFSELYTQVVSDKAANTFLAGPATGVASPSFRAIASADIPTSSISLAKLATEVMNLLVPIGSIFAFSSLTPPANYLLCGGQAISRTTYADLFTLIGTTYGSGDGSTTFNLPNLTGRVIAGVDTLGSVLGLTGNLGTTFGAPTHTLSGVEMPPHVHGFSAPILTTTGSGQLFFASGAFSTGFTSQTASAGSGAAHNNLQPSMTLPYIIRVI